jgi:hypothetical protein
MVSLRSAIELTHQMKDFQYAGVSRFAGHGPGIAAGVLIAGPLSTATCAARQPAPPSDNQPGCALIHIPSALPAIHLPA